MRHSGKSLEDAIRDVQRKNQHKPSPLKFLNPEKPLAFVPQQVTPITNSRQALVGDFKPQKYTF